VWSLWDRCHTLRKTLCFFDLKMKVSDLWSDINAVYLKCRYKKYEKGRKENI
jgi:hypothetical protein